MLNSFTIDATKINLKKYTDLVIISNGLTFICNIIK